MKMSPRVHSILSEVHRLLGSYTASELDQASNYEGIGPHIRIALHALSCEASSDSPKHQREPQRVTPNHGTLRHARGKDSLSDIITTIRRSARFSSTQSIIQFANDAGLNLEPRPKESRERVARRVAAAILSLREPKRSQVVARISGEGDSQTQGWIDAIKATRS
jgi:hypothetical protein